LSAKALTYWPSGGDIIAANGRVIAADEARRMHIRHLNAAAHGDEGCARAEALRLAAELRGTIEAVARWRRAAARYEPAGLATSAANSSRELTFGTGPSGTAMPRKSHSGPHPSATS